MQDLTLDSFAYLRLPLVVAGIALLIGVVGTFRAAAERAFLAAALMMVLFFHAARIAMVMFDPYLILETPGDRADPCAGRPLIVEGHYYQFSSVFFYADRTALLLSGRRVNLEYGSYAPGAPQVFIDDSQFKTLWNRIRAAITS